MSDPLVQTTLIDLDKTDFAADAREHDPSALEILAHDMADQGQLQEIIVEAKGGRYLVISGVGRTLAARKLGWKQIRASVRENVSNFERARITFAENEDREDVNPYYQAMLIAKMLNVKKCTQQGLANELGISEALVNAYVAVDKLPLEIKQKLRRLNLGQLTQIARLDKAKEQISVARKCAKNDLSVRQVKALVDKLIGKTPPVSPTRRAAPPPLPDPLADTWPPIQTHIDLAPGVHWEVKYGEHKLGDGVSLKGWFFFVAPMSDAKPKPSLATWFRQMGQALSGSKIKPEAMEFLQGTEEPERNSADGFKPRLPKTPKEQKELADIAERKGPKAVYTWIYGADSPMIQAVPVNSWKEAGLTPAEGLRQILDGIRKMQQ